MKLTTFIAAVCIALLSSMTLAKLPTPPPEDPKVTAEKAEKAKAAAEKAKVLQVAAEERAVKNYQGNMKKAGKPIPRPTPIVTAQAPAAPGAPVTSALAKVPEKPAAKK